jgi:hypothetical protein
MSQLGQPLPSQDFCGTAALPLKRRSARLARQKSAKTGHGLPLISEEGHGP